MMADYLYYWMLKPGMATQIDVGLPRVSLAGLAYTIDRAMKLHGLSGQLQADAISSDKHDYRCRHTNQYHLHGLVHLTTSGAIMAHGMGVLPKR